MNSVFCRYPSLEPAVIVEVMNVFRDGDDVDMSRVHRTLQEMCPACDQAAASTQSFELVQQPLHESSGAEVAPVHDVSTPSPRLQPSSADTQANLRETGYPHMQLGQEDTIGPKGEHIQANATSETEGGVSIIRRQNSSELDFLLSVFPTVDPGVVSAVYEAGSDFESVVATLEEISGQKMLRPERKSAEELRISLMHRFPKASAHDIAEAISRHSGDEDACIAYLMTGSYTEGGGRVLQDPEELKERLIHRFPTVPVQGIETLVSRHHADEDACVAHILAHADSSGAADVSANYEQEQQDTEFLDMFTKRGVPGHDTLRRKILAVRQRLRTELLDQGLLACMPSAERIAAALVFCALDGDKAQRLLRHNGAVSLPPFEELYNPRVVQNAASTSAVDTSPAGKDSVPVRYSNASAVSPTPRNKQADNPKPHHEATQTASAPQNISTGPPSFYNPPDQDFQLQIGAANSPCHDSMHENCAQMNNSESANFDPTGGADSQAGCSPYAGCNDASMRDCDSSPDCLEVLQQDSDNGPLQQLRARLAQPPPDDTLCALLLCTNGDVPAAVQMLSESGMQVLPDPASAADPAAGNYASSSSRMQSECGYQNAGPMPQGHQDTAVHCEIHTGNNEQDESMLVWLWRPEPLSSWVAGEVEQIDMCDGETKLTIRTQDGVIHDVEQGLLWPRGRGEPPPAALQEERHGGDSGSLRAQSCPGTSGDLRDACTGVDRVTQHERMGVNGTATSRVASCAGARPVLAITLPPEEQDEDLSRYRGEELAVKTQQLYMRLNEPLNLIKREISALQRTIDKGGNGSSRKKLRALMHEKKVQKQLLEEAVTQRMFRARNHHAEVSRVDYHGISVDEAMRMLHNKLKYLKSNPDPVRMLLLIITGRGLHSKDNFGRLYHAIGEYLSLECTIHEFNIAHRAVLGAYVVEVFKDNQRPHPPSEREARDILRSN